MFTKGIVAYSEGANKYVEFALERQRQAEAKKELVETSEKISGNQTNGNEAYKVSLSQESKEKLAFGDSKSTTTEEKPVGKEAKELEPESGELWRRGKTKEEQRRIELEINELKNIDAKVKAHEQAHKGTGGMYAGAISYQRTTGPDGKQYAVGGEVSISMSSGATPSETIAKMQVVKRAALAPADPSSQDKSVASAASAKEAQARVELSEENREKSKKAAEEAKVNLDKPVVDIDKVKESNPKIFKDEKAQQQEPNLGAYVDISA